VRDNGYCLDAVHPALLANRDVVLAAVMANGMALQFAVEWQTDKDVVCAAVSRDCFALRYVADTLKADREVILAALEGQSHRDVLRLAAEPMRDNKEVVLAVLRKHGYALEFASERLRADPEVVQVAISQAGRSVMKYAMVAA